MSDAKMIEEIVLDYLNTRLDVPVYMEKPEVIPEEYVLLEKTGGGKENHINAAVFAVQSHAETLYKSAKLNEIVKKTMDEIIALDEIGSADLNSDYYFPDTTKKKYRYQAVYDLTY